MWFLVFLFVSVAALFVYRMTSKRRVAQRTYLAQRAAISALKNDVARRRALHAISTWKIERNQPGAVVDQPSLGALTREFISEYSEIVSPNSAHRLGLQHLAPSRYRPAMLAIGQSDYLDICVLPDSDTVYVIDGSEADGDLDDKYPSVFHLLVDYGEPTSS